MDTKHVVQDDPTAASDTLIRIISYPNPSVFGPSVALALTKPALFHMLIVNEEGIPVYVKNQLIRNVNARRGAGDLFPKGIIYSAVELSTKSFAHYKTDSYFRIYYYFSAKDNKCFGQGYGDIYLGANLPTRADTTGW